MYNDGTGAGTLIGVMIAVCVTGGVIAGMIAYTKNRTAGNFIGFFILGALLPVIGIVAAALTQRASAPGWYPDPWQQAAYRWHDGSNWTGQTG